MNRIEINCQTGEMQSVPLTDEEILNAVEKTAEEKKIEYRHLRLMEYPSIGDQMDAIIKWLDGQNVSGELAEIIGKCKAVKLKYPKQT